MKSITYKRASTLDELEQIRTLQLQNSPQNITSEEKLQEGFVTVQHTVALLEQMNAACAHIIAKDNNTVVGFALVMLSDFRNEIKVLIPMFERIDELVPKDKTYVVMGQICVDKNYRKQGIFRGLYHFYREELQHEFDYLITEVAAINLRSMQAHEAVGFKTIDNYEENGIVWNIMLWDWT
ncbi:GNAT family N-acetyltransferase [Flavobacterium gawalongense]|uniref:GNAT family N-acetyltransferase n=1 Tax=Flavobacterium gawalongense TaxID=2594432 RepID=A0A553BW81_9FLAO|nr:GNAT family N-acetyltransferase [Flavobacterium gawalongense]TRX02087.1 GNAT family N-acetyltransferase [Flavobacterium gawalongense]TRX06615.1 GNAT family N-acetyltransferase [Flavobacterium gawalongense]TRX12456.1 GNAT family N-acetyltransferase [Flavobacterium gawalongense]TRX12723.1 GNAT family N-acetyltransferase [Flavobacterium gawalongense]TRX30488.1 GNAT family N-acetyltransferase [Flavobacterium gawalongense]